MLRLSLTVLCFVLGASTGCKQPVPPAPEAPPATPTRPSAAPAPPASAAPTVIPERLRLGELRLRHGSRVSLLAWDQNGKTLRSGAADGTLRAWKRSDGRLAREERLGGAPMAVAADGTLLLVTANGDCVLRGPAGDRTIGCASTLATLSSDGKHVAAAVTRELRLFDAVSGAERLRVQPDGQTGAVAFSRDGAQVATGSRHGHVAVWATADGAAQVRQRTAGTVMGFAFHPTGSLAIAAPGTSVRLISPPTGALVRRFPIDGGLAQAVAFSARGDLLAASMRSGAIRVWSVADGKVLQAGLALDDVERLAFDPTSERLAAATGAFDLAVFELSSGHRLHTDPAAGHVGRVAAVAMPSSRRVITAGADGRLLAWDASTGAVVGQATVEGEAVRLVGRKGGVVTTLESGATLRWNLRDPPSPGSPDRLTTSIGAWTTDDEEPEAAALSADGRILAVTTAESTIRVGAIDGAPSKARLLEHEALEGDVVALSRRGDRIAASGDEGLLAWAVGTGDPLPVPTTRLGVTALAFSPDGARLAIGWSDASVSVWAFEPPAAGCRREGHEGGITAVTWSADGRVLVSASEDGTAIAWSADALSAACPSEYHPRAP